MIRVDARIYVRSHGKAPRGRGSWAFSFQPEHRQLIDDAFWSSINASYSAAVKEAKAEAKRLGHSIVWVLP